ncbi:ABC transporter ATP-binding protein [Halococcus sp. IIIV-5B]|uniref:ABC transporter ATP-binding protein n=1 Tax=Halococcus sp. IIIV-5B TaxID=2321230 RepID=UPI000E716A99|nr:ABC transporter ATP-binding protein [Halococcus sp. IIIV-5B]RJT04859.1 ABC transporter ATP-binding protein [Halococcus sp. IIIV-5B]
MSTGGESVFDEYREAVDRPIYRLFADYGLDHRRWFATGMTANVIARGASLLPPLVLGVAIDAVFPTAGSGAPYELPFVPQTWLPTTDGGQFALSVGLIVGAFLVTAVFTWVYGVTANNFAHRVMHDVRTDCYAKMQNLDMPFFDDKQTGEVMAILNNDATNLERFLDDALHDSARLVVMIGGIAAILVWMNPQLALVTLVAVPAMALLTRWFMRAVEPRYVAQRKAVGALNTRLENSLSGIGLVKTTGTEDYETERVTDASYTYFERTMAMLRLNYLYRPGMELLAGLSFSATFVVGGWWLATGEAPLFLTGSLTTGTFVTFLLMSQRFVTPLSEVSTIIDQYENARASSERVFGLMRIPASITNADDATTLRDPAGEVSYEDVTFGYDEEVVIDDVSFSADPGETIALVGPTGAGKSTLLKLLLRLYDVDEGSIALDGHDIRDLTLESLREAIGYVAQDTYLFDGTIAENLRYGAFDATEEEMVEAAKAAESHAFITALPEGYDTRVGERGVKLSGGQRQRLAIARAMLQDPPVLVLDEATSDVDTETEAAIQRSLERLTEDRTTFVIAHRLSTVTNADRVFVLRDGRIEERGSHDDLLDAEGSYAQLWRAQSSGGVGSALD